jgi:uncharacterized membrane protein YkvA (DUF1232 family)
LSFVAAVLGLLLSGPACLFGDRCADEYLRAGEVAYGASYGAAWALSATVAVASAPGPVAQTERFIKQLGKTIRGAVSRWGDDWLPRLGVVFVLAILMPIFDRAIFATLFAAGARAALRSAALAVLVYLRLLFDRRTPGVGKLLVAFSVVYGVALRDLLPDAMNPSGQLDDFLVLLVGAKAFTTMCPSNLIEQHARVASRRLNGRQLPTPEKKATD